MNFFVTEGKIVYDYSKLIGYKEAAKNLAKESEMEFPKTDMEYLQKRIDIRSDILLGKIDEAILKINKIDEEILIMNRELNFDLQL